MLIYIRVQAQYGGDKNASGLEVVCPMPQEVQRVSCTYDQEPKPSGSQTWDWQEKARRLVWKFKRFQGGNTHVLKVHTNHSSSTPCHDRSQSDHLIWYVGSAVRARNEGAPNVVRLALH